MSQIFQFAVLGLSTGAIYSLFAMGLVITNRASGVVNFAHAAIGMIGTFVFWDINQVHHQSYFLGALAGVAASAASAVLVQQCLMRPLREAAPVTRMVATLGALTVFEQAAAHIWTNDTVLLPSELPTRAVRMLGVTVGLDKLLILGIATVLALGLGAFTRFSNFGRATTASAENPRAIAALGYSPNALALGNWLVGGALAGVAGILLAPILQLQIDQYTLLILPALAAAVVGRLSSLPWTFAGGLLLGVIQSEATRYVTQPGWPDAAPFIVIAVVLVARGNDRTFRSHVFERLPNVGEGTIRLPVVVAAVVASVAFVELVGATWSSAFMVTLLSAIVVLSVVVVTGYSGQLSLAQFAFAGWGAWTASRFAEHTGWSLIPTLVFGVALTIPLGLVVGILCLRTRGVYLAIASLGFASALQALVFNSASLTGSTSGIIVPTTRVFGLNVDSTTYPDRYALVALAAFILCSVVVANIRRGRSGRRMLAVRANDRAAASLGIGTVAARLYAFTVGSAIAAVGGILIAFEVPTVTFTNYSPLQSINVITQAVVGGAGWIAGSINGGMLQTGSIGSTLLDKLGNAWAGYLTGIGGVLVIITVLFVPDGFASQQWRDGRRLARRLRRPSRTADSVALEAVQVVERTRASLQIVGLSVAFGSTIAVNEVTLVVEPGRVTGLIGPNGAGKTTLIDAVTGYVPSRSGTVTIGDSDITGLSPARIARAGVTRSFQSLELFEDMTILDNLRVACEPRDSWSYLLDVIWPRRTSLSGVAIAAIKDFGLEAELLKKPQDVSFGTRRLVGIARAVATGATVLLLDEPAAGLSDRETHELGVLVRSLAVDWGVAVLVVEHNVQLIMDICDDVYVLNFGKVISQGSAPMVRADPVVVDAYLGTSLEIENGVAAS
jgi:ABC-type branched-subunit amino acid transport system ATPase component/branched-subunit amino acid ABC-type transport system permease component